VPHVIGRAQGDLLPSPPAPADLGSLRTEVEEAGTYDVALYAVGASAEFGLAGVEFDLAYDRTPLSGVDLDAWEWAGDWAFLFLGWPAEGGWIDVTWNSFQTCPTDEYLPIGVVRVTVYGPDQLRIVAAPRSATVQVGSCLQDGYPDLFIDEIPDEQVGWLGFGGMAGGAPKSAGEGPVPVERISFGGLKARYR
jgi:hypothetical protein